jgi:hypothetical protein
MTKEFNSLKEENIKFRYIMSSATLIAVVSIITVGVVLIKNEKIRRETDSETERMRIDLNRRNIELNVYMDKFTYCMQSVMGETAKSGKFLDANKAREICAGLEKGSKN